MKSFKLNKKIFVDRFKTIFVALIIALIIKSFFFNATMVRGDSMNYTLLNNDVLLVDKITNKFSEYKHGDIVIFKSPYNEKKLYIKRIIALPGDSIELKKGKFYLNGEELIEPYISADYTYQNGEFNQRFLSDDSYFVVGDNRFKGKSDDSRAFGPISKKSIIGHATFRFYPLNRIDILK